LVVTERIWGKQLRIVAATTISVGVIYGTIEECAKTRKR
jgi:hypothetical protein